MVGHREEVLFGEIFSEKYDNAKEGKTKTSKISVTSKAYWKDIEISLR